MLVLSEATDRLPPSQSQRDLVAATETARLLGARIFGLEPDFERCGDAEGALAHLECFPDPTPALWIGYIPTKERYADVHSALERRNAYLPNDPEQFARAMEFAGFYPRLQGLTPESVLLHRAEDCEQARALGFPLFVKGTIQSAKQRGWKACVVESASELERRVRNYLLQPQWCRGPVVARKIARLRHTRTSAEGFPFGREYRVFVLNREVLGCGYYWEGDDPLEPLSASERTQVQNLALEAARRLEVPYVAIDIGQTENLDWIVIESGDAQFCGLCAVPRLELWTRLRAALARP